MNLLVLGQDLTAHAIARLCAQSALSPSVFVLPGNAGTAHEDGCTNVPIHPSRIETVLAFIETEQIQGVFLQASKDALSQVPRMQACASAPKVITYLSSKAPQPMPAQAFGVHTEYGSSVFAHAEALTHDKRETHFFVPRASGASLSVKFDPSPADLHIGCVEHGIAQPLHPLAYAALSVAHKGTWEHDLLIAVFETIEKRTQDPIQGLQRVLSYGAARYAVGYEQNTRSGRTFQSIPNEFDTATLWGASRTWHRARVVYGSLGLVGCGDSRAGARAVVDRIEQREDIQSVLDAGRSAG